MALGLTMLFSMESLGSQLVGLLTEQLGGTITLERGAGTTVTIYFAFHLAQMHSQA